MAINRKIIEQHAGLPKQLFGERFFDMYSLLHIITKLDNIPLPAQGQEGFASLHERHQCLETSSDASKGFSDKRLAQCLTTLWPGYDTDEMKSKAWNLTRQTVEDWDTTGQRAGHYLPQFIWMQQYLANVLK